MTPGAQNNKLGDPSFYRGGGSRCFYQSSEKIFVNKAWELFNPQNFFTILTRPFLLGIRSYIYAMLFLCVVPWLGNATLELHFTKK